MKELAIASGLCILLSGCVGFSWISKVDDGAIYELNRETVMAERENNEGCIDDKKGNFRFVSRARGGGYLRL